MKKLVFLLLGIIFSHFTVSVNAQLKVHNNGNIILGDISQTPTSLLELSGSTESIEISNKDETEAGIIFYDRGYESTQYCKMFFDCQTNNLIWYINSMNEYKMSITPNGNLHITGALYQWSDSSVKTNVKMLDNEYYNIYDLSSYSYNIKNEGNSILSDNEEIIFNEKNKQIKHFGFIAQELREVYPELVFENSKGQLSVDYISLIPLVVEALKDQKKELEELNAQIAELNGGLKKSVISAKESFSSDFKPNTLYQNSPNPFHNSTTIKYYTIYNNGGSINIYDLRGKQLKSYSIISEGEGSITIPATEFEPGMYLYNLIVDDKIIDTKQMIITS